MKFTYLGTSASESIPAIFCECDMCNEARRRGGKDIRMRSCAVINDDVMLDCGPEAHCQAVRFGVHLSKIKHLLVTHPHNDHFFPHYFTLRGGFWALKLYEDVLTVYGGREVYEKINDFVTNGREQVRPHLAAHRFSPFDTVETEDYKFTALRAAHDPSIECLFYLIEDKRCGKRVLYMHDTENDIEDSLQHIAGIHCDMVSIDCTMGNEFVEKGFRHMGLKNNILVRDRLRELGCIDNSTRLICNHICHHKGLYDDLSAIVGKEGFELSYDGMTVEL